MRHGATGYAIYFHCLELIAGNVSNTNITFELEHDSEIIADNLRIRGTNDKSGIEIVEEIMRYIVELDLFENRDGRITCFKMIRRLDSSMTGNPEFRKLIEKAKNCSDEKSDSHDFSNNSHDYTEESHDSVMECHDFEANSHDSVIAEQTRLEQTRLEQKNTLVKIDSSRIIETFNSICTSLPKVKNITDKRKKAISAISKNFAEVEIFAAFDKVQASDFLTNRDGKGWQCSFDWIMNKNNFVKITEGNYDNKGKSRASKPRFKTEPGNADVSEYNHEV